jgi:hypothetical protein
MDSDLIIKYSKHKTKDLKDLAQKYFNAYIRKRDEGQMCISCGNKPVQQAGHYFSAGKFNGLRFHEDNVHGQCIQCNFYLHGNLIHYRANLEKKIGKKKLDELELKASKTTIKNDRFQYIEIIKKYK